MTRDAAYSVSPMNSKHVDAVAEIHGTSFDDPWTATMIRRILAMPGAFGLIAAHGGADEIIGFALARIAADECELLSLGVAAEHRGRGVGGMLLQAAMAWARARDAGQFFLEVAEDNAVALRLYTAHGLRQVGRRPDYYELKGGGFAAALTMRRPLEDMAPDER